MGRLGAVRRRTLAVAGILALVGAGAGAIGSGLAPRLAGYGGPGYEVVDRWELRGGGYGMYVAVAPGLTPEDLRRLGERLRDGTAREPGAVVIVFDDAQAARTVRTGARVVGNEAYERAIPHQLAIYLKQAGSSTFTILAEPKVVIRY
jgi:hypothetical protein